MANLLKCSSRNKKKNNTEEINCEITPEHYALVDKELRLKYEEQFNKDSMDKSYKYFSEEEQIQRYASMLVFWDTNRPCDNGLVDAMNDPYTAAKMFYVSNMRAQVDISIIQKFDFNMQNRIEARYDLLLNVYNTILKDLSTT